MRRVFKFGGASMKDAEAIRNMAEIVKNQFTEKELLIVVVSAMGKTTNALEAIFQNALKNENTDALIEELFKFHLKIVSALFQDSNHPIYGELEKLATEIKTTISSSKNIEEISEAQLYDSIIPYGEIISSTIIQHFLSFQGLNSSWLDARSYILTSSDFREGIVDWESTRRKIGKLLNQKSSIILTQGFIGSDEKGRSTTLGREGSDFTAAIFGNCLHAESVTIWKDVPGILNADPKLLSETRLFPRLSYTEASEMTYYGASVIHPKTIKPLANDKIPLFVRSFVNPNNDGTVIAEEASDQKIPVYILKNNQALISFKVRDFSFINEEQISRIFKALNDLLIKINMMQNSAISLTVAIDNREDKIKKLLNQLSPQFKIDHSVGLDLITIINYEPESISHVERRYEIILEQRTRNTCQYLVKTKPQ